MAAILSRPQCVNEHGITLLVFQYNRFDLNIFILILRRITTIHMAESLEIAQSQCGKLDMHIFWLRIIAVCSTRPMYSLGHVYCCIICQGLIWLPCGIAIMKWKWINLNDVTVLLHGMRCLMEQWHLTVLVCTQCDGTIIVHVNFNPL